MVIAIDARTTPTVRGSVSPQSASTGFDALYRRYARVVHGVVLAHVGPQEAEDLTQEVFVTVFRRADSVRDKEALGAWICSIARNSAIDHLRRCGRRPREVELDEVVARGSGSAGGAGECELGARVLALLQELPAAYRETLVLRLVEGLTGPEIADRTGMTHGSVRVNLCRGLAMLRPLLRQEGWQ